MAFEDLVVDQLLGQVVVDLLVRQEAARLAHLDERLQLMAALGDFLFGERGFFQAELAHQRALLGARHLHAQRLGLGLRFLVEWACGSSACVFRCMRRTTRAASLMHTGRATAKRTLPSGRMQRDACRAVERA
jgi:hypothetical protein